MPTLVGAEYCCGGVTPTSIPSPDIHQKGETELLKNPAVSPHFVNITLGPETRNEMPGKLQKQTTSAHSLVRSISFLDSRPYYSWKIPPTPTLGSDARLSTGN